MKLKVMLVMNMVLSAVGAKEAAGMDKVVDFFDKIDPIMTAGLAGLNLYLVFTVFRFTKKMSQSKLSISPNLIRKFTPPANVVDNYQKRDQEFFKVFDLKEFDGEGFPYISERTKPEVLYLKVNNRGDLPSTNIKIELNLKIYKTKIKYDKRYPDRLDILSQSKKRHSNKKFIVTIPYMGADEERLYDLCEIYGQFREVELVLIKIKANGHTYFKEKVLNYLLSPTIIFHYKHPDFENAKDTESKRKMYGHKTTWGTFDLIDQRNRNLERMNAQSWWQKLWNKINVSKRFRN